MYIAFEIVDALDFWITFIFFLIVEEFRIIIKRTWHEESVPQYMLIKAVIGCVAKGINLRKIKYTWDILSVEPSIEFEHSCSLLGKS